MDRDRPAAANEHSLALGHAIDRAKLVILWERVWPRLVLFLGIFGCVLAVSWLGFWQVVPYWARFGGVVFVLALLFIAALPILTIRRPTEQEALRRVDRSTGGGHRPATALADGLATRDDPFARALWDAHRARVAAATGRLRTGIPMPRMANLDRYAIRALALLLIVPAYFLAGDERTARLLTAFDWRAPPAPITYRIDAWVTPPSYTGRPPVILPTRRSGDAAGRAAEPDVFKVPAGSVVTLRVTGLSNVEVRPTGGVAAAPVAETAGQPPATAPANALAESRWTIAQDGSLTVRGAGAEPLDWRFEAIGDRAPTIAFERDPQTDQRNQLVLSYKVEDDYGVTEAEASMGLAPSAQALQREGARPLAELPPIPLAMPQARTRSGSGQTARDFLAHPFAGLQVTVKLRARDDAGNEGFSDTVVATLPQRAFSKPIPRALIEQRRILALDANAKSRVARALEALTTAPDRFGMEMPVYLGLRTAYFRLARARDDAALKEVIDYLWDIAVRMEDGDVSEAERAVAEAAERLRQAIERGASDEEIRRLSQNLRQAMDRLMRELAEQQLRNRQQGNQQQAQRDPNTRSVRPQDLRDMLNRIENLARNGARDQAQRLMQELQQMLQGLQAGRQQQQQQQAEGDGTEQGESPLDRLSDMIRRQQQLRDQTFRRNQEQRRAQRGQQRPGQRGQQGQQGQQQPGQQGQQGEQGEGQQGYGELGDAQRELRELLDQLREQLGQQGQGQGQGEGQSEAGRQAEQGMEGAGRAMREAEGALGRGDGQGATDAQGRALRQLQQGAQGLAQQMQEGQGQGQGQQGQPGQPGRSGQAGNQDYDPLGRPTRGREANDNAQVRIPNAGEGAAQRAQRVLEELRRRLSDPERPQVEMDYIERLLRGLQIQ